MFILIEKLMGEDQMTKDYDEAMFRFCVACWWWFHLVLSTSTCATNARG